MKPLNLLLLSAFVILSSVYVNSESPCDQEECSTTDYQSYIDCIRKRAKRSADCPYTANSCQDSNSCSQNDCDSCDCNSCNNNNNCESSCNECCTTCCNNYTPCNSNHCCHKVCHANCKSSTCRSSCRKSCYDYVKNDAANNNVNITLNQPNQHNITTVINLHNYINNTNNINVPVVVNNTNINNITIEEEAQEQNQFERTVISTNSTNCCMLISPRQCRKQEKFPYLECFHYRTKICDQRCQAPVVHAQPHEICDQIPNQAPSCHQQIIYIPQPQPRCAYQPAWPYVNCGMQSRPQCEGCYSHYVNRNEFSQCSSYCYDDGFGAGPYYRQGPFYRPGYAHVPSCLQMNLCTEYDFYNSGYGGGYPGYGAPPPPPNYGYQYPMYGVGYPPGSYDNVYFIETNRTSNDSQLPNTINQEVPQFVADPVLYPEYPNYVSNLDNVPNNVQIEAKVEAHRPQRDAVITIKADKENVNKKEDEKRKKEKEKKEKKVPSSSTASSTLKSKVG